MGEPARIESGSVLVRIATPCSQVIQDWAWSVRGAPMLFVEPAEIALDSTATTATALVSASWHGLPYTITGAGGEQGPQWLRIRPRRGRTPHQGSGLTGDQLSISADPALAPSGAVAELWIHAWQGSAPAKLTVRFTGVANENRQGPP